MHAPGGGQCGTQGCSLFRAEDTTLLPTKNLMVSYQMLGSLPVAVNAGFQVAFTRSAKGLFRLTSDAMILSCVSLLLIIFSHRFLISFWEWTFSWMTRSHLRTQIK